LNRQEEKVSDASEITTAKSSLAKSREEIRAITKSILDLANARQKAALKVSGDKALLGEAVANLEIENKLMSESLDYARSIGLDEDLAKSLVIQLFKFSKIAQNRDIYSKQVKQFLDSKNIRKICIVGAGRMGVWFAKYFRDLSVTVNLYDHKAGKAKEKAAEIGASHFDDFDKVVESDFIIVSVPISKTCKVIHEIISLKNKSPTRDLRIVEISSVKNEIGSSGILNSAVEGVSIYSIHPLFGASAHPFDSNSIVQSFPKDTTFLRGLFPHFTVVMLEWKEQDKLMGLFLSLPHALALVFSDAIQHDQTQWVDALGLSGPSYSHMLELSRKVLSEDPEVYFEIQASNPNSVKVLSDAMNSLLKLEKALKSRSDFVEFFETSRRKLEELEKLKDP
jgi:prephenate dehydrogenase/chorismate mutase